MIFTAFPALNNQHADEYNKLAATPFTGEPMKILKKVEGEAVAAADPKAAKKEVKKEAEKDPLASTEEEDVST